MSRCRHLEKRMGPYKITMRLDFCGNRATSRGRVICCIRSLLSFFSSFFLFVCRRTRASATISTDRRSYNKLRNNNFISPLIRRLSFHQYHASPPFLSFNRAFSSLLIRLSVISLLLHFLHIKYFSLYLVIVNNYHRKFVKQWCWRLLSVHVVSVSPCARNECNVHVCMRVYVYTVYVCVLWACLSRMYIMHLDGKVSHVAANIVTVVSVRVHTSGNSSGTSSDKYNGTH